MPKTTSSEHIFKAKLTEGNLLTIKNPFHIAMTLIIYIILVICALLIPYLAIILEISGSLFSNFITFLFPGALYL